MINVVLLGVVLVALVYIWYRLYRLNRVLNVISFANADLQQLLNEQQRMLAQLLKAKASHNIPTIPQCSCGSVIEYRPDIDNRYDLWGCPVCKQLYVESGGNFEPVFGYPESVRQGGNHEQRRPD